MSLAQVKSFFGKVSQDPALQGKLRALQLESKRAWLAAIVELGSETGHSFTAAEFETAVAELQAEPGHRRGPDLDWQGLLALREVARSRVLGCAAARI